MEIETECPTKKEVEIKLREVLRIFRFKKLKVEEKWWQTQNLKNVQNAKDDIKLYVIMGFAIPVLKINMELVQQKNNMEIMR